ncbi:MAG: polysaccharide deacetylase family protein [Oscillospiraceae bacterium]|jgi:peptidoglycan-N-acetylmuramic acid deacetylase|nr:polysaccharide deacetylase family protein [Oscillospiraceae bacterium]
MEQKKHNLLWILLPCALVLTLLIGGVMLWTMAHSDDVPTLPEDIPPTSSGFVDGITAPVLVPKTDVPVPTTPPAPTSEQTSTYTGFVPLPTLAPKVEDPAQIRALPTKRVSHSYGISKNGQPAQDSINFQKFFDDKGYAALTLDTKCTDKRLYLTFDEGYENGYTGKILDTLKEKDVPAAFFCTLPYLKTDPELVARMINEGHIVGNHSVTHPDFSTISRAKMLQELQGFDNHLRTNFGYTAPYFRFPTGAYNEVALDAVESLDFTSVFWSVAWSDWDPKTQKGKQAAFDTITGRLHPGAVILLHAVSSSNTAALGDIIDWARAQGYTFVPLSEYK